MYASIARQRVASLDLVCARYILPYWTFANSNVCAFSCLEEFKNPLNFILRFFLLLATSSMSSDFDQQSASGQLPSSSFAFASWWLIISFSTLKNRLSNAPGISLLFTMLFLGLNAFFVYIQYQYEQSI